MRRRRVLIVAAPALSLLAVCISMFVAADIFSEASSQTLATQTQIFAAIEDKRQSAMQALLDPVERLLPKSALKGNLSEARRPSAIKDLKLASANLARRPKFPQRFDKLMAKAQRNGVVSVIVELRTVYQPEHKLSNDAERQAQRALISEAKNGALSGLKYNPSTLKTFDGLPFIAINVDPDGLAQLQASGYVLDLTEDNPMKLTLHQSLPVIGATKAWAGGLYGAGQTVVILDSGVDKTHPALSGKVVAEACYSTTNSAGASSLCLNGAPEDHGPDSGKNCTELPGLGACYHGTHIANIAAGRYGVAPEANIISIQVMSKNTSVSECGIAPCLVSYTSDIIKALNYVYTDLRHAHTIAAVNISRLCCINIEPSH